MDSPTNDRLIREPTLPHSEATQPTTPDHGRALKFTTFSPPKYSGSPSTDYKVQACISNSPADIDRLDNHHNSTHPSNAPHFSLPTMIGSNPPSKISKQGKAVSYAYDRRQDYRTLIAQLNQKVWTIPPFPRTDSL